MKHNLKSVFLRNGIIGMLFWGASCYYGASIPPRNKLPGPVRVVAEAAYAPTRIPEYMTQKWTWIEANPGSWQDFSREVRMHTHPRYEKRKDDLDRMITRDEQIQQEMYGEQGLRERRALEQQILQTQKELYAIRANIESDVKNPITPYLPHPKNVLLFGLLTTAAVVRSTRHSLYRVPDEKSS